MITLPLWLFVAALAVAAVIGGVVFIAALFVWFGLKWGEGA